MQKGFSNLLIIIAAAIVVITVLIGLTSYLSKINFPKTYLLPGTMPTSLQNKNEDTSKLRTYANTKYGYVLNYPSDYKTEEDLIGTKQPNNDNGITLYTPDTKYNALGGWPVSGLEFRIMGAADQTVINNEEPEAVQKTTPNVIFDKSIAYPAIPLPSGFSATAYYNPKGADRPYVNVDFVKSDQTGKHLALIQISCIGDIEKCKQTLPSIIATLKFN